MSKYVCRALNFAILTVIGGMACVTSVLGPQQADDIDPEGDAARVRRGDFHSLEIQPAQARRVREGLQLPGAHARGLRAREPAHQGRK